MARMRSRAGRAVQTVTLAPEVHVEALAGSIKLQGMLVPLFVREHADGFELVAGFHASPPRPVTRPGRVHEVTDATPTTEEADRAVENITRKQLNPYEEAKAVRDVLDRPPDGGRRSAGTRLVPRRASRRASSCWSCRSAPAVGHRPAARDVQATCRIVRPTRGGDYALLSPRVVVFPTFEFAFFFPVVLTLSWALMPHQRLWKPFALAASYVFYAAASPRYCILLAAITLANQLGAVLVHRAPDDRRRKRITAITVAFDLGLLGVFKYYGFFADEWGRFWTPWGSGCHYRFSPLAFRSGCPSSRSRPSRTWSTSSAASFPRFDPGRRHLPELLPHVVAGPIVRARQSSSPSCRSHVTPAT